MAAEDTGRDAAGLESRAGKRQLGATRLVSRLMGWNYAVW
ncbi:hypothetical protein TIFTF001_055977, partial [Ficus carica]